MCEYHPDGDRCYYDPEYCDGHECVVDCYRCPYAEREDESEENPEDAG